MLGAAPRAEAHVGVEAVAVLGLDSLSCFGGGRDAKQRLESRLDRRPRALLGCRQDGALLDEALAQLGQLGHLGPVRQRLHCRQQAAGEGLERAAFLQQRDQSGVTVGAPAQAAKDGTLRPMLWTVVMAERKSQRVGEHVAQRLRRQPSRHGPAGCEAILRGWLLPIARRLSLRHRDRLALSPSPLVELRTWPTGT